MSKHFEVEISNKPPEVISARDTDNPEAWFRDNVSNNRAQTVVLNTTAYLRSDIRGVREVRPRHGSANISGA